MAALLPFLSLSSSYGPSFPPSFPSLSPSRSSSSSPPLFSLAALPLRPNTSFTSRPLAAVHGASFGWKSGEIWRDHEVGVRGRNGSRWSEGDERDGVAEDMEKYLKDLSLEYESVWDTKPAWCQPWTIVLTGILIVSSSWFLFHSTPITAISAFLVTLWWFIFLYSYPLAYSKMIEERRKISTNNIKDGS